MSKRVEWIDIVKGIGIFFMVVGHAGNIPNVKLWIYSFHMPLFFILTGYIYSLSKKERFNGVKGFTFLIKRNVKSYLIPYIVLFTINFLFTLLLDLLKDSSSEIFGKIVSYCLKGFMYSYDTELPNCAPLWFLTCLFVAYVFFWFIMQSKRFKFLIALFYLGVLFIILRIENNIGIDELPWHIDVALLASFFMLIGYYFPKIQHLLDDRNIFIHLSVLIVLAIGGSIIGVYNGRINMVKNEYQNIFLFLLSAVSISFALIEFVRKITDKVSPIVRNPLIFWGMNTIIFMGVQLPY